MTEAPQSPSASFVDEVAESVRFALAALDRREPAFRADSSGRSVGEPPRVAALGRLEESLSGWQRILSGTSEIVRMTQDDLTALDSELKRSLAAFAAARKHLQGAWDEAADSSSS